VKLDKPTLVTRTLADLVSLEINARYMRKETYDRLVANLADDGCLTSTPLIYGGNGDYPEGHELILSGNHRVAAAIEAGIVEANCLLITQRLPHTRQVALQLSHNALSGEDDLATLKLLYDGIDDLDDRAYAGLDDKTLELLDGVDLESLSEANLDFTTIMLTFLPEEAERARAALEHLGRSADETWLARIADYNRMLDALGSAHSSYNVGNVAAALGILIALAEKHVTDLQDGYFDPDRPSEPRHRGHVGLEVVFGSRLVPAATAAALTRAIKCAVDDGRVDGAKPWELLDIMVADFLDPHR
jgi:hypothetical protein